MKQAKFQSFKEFFKSPSVEFNQPFPKSAIKIGNIEQSIQLDYFIKGKDRLFTFMHNNYQNFVNNSNIDEIISDILLQPFKVNRDRNKFVSFTDIYDNVPDFTSSKHQKTYSSFMIGQWQKYSNCIQDLAEKYSYCYFLDIENFYSHIYIHFLLSLSLKCEDDFKNFEKMSKNDREAIYQKLTPLIWNLHEKIMVQLSYNSQTKGLAIGNGVSDFVSEMILQVIEYFLYLQTKEMEYQIIRFRDDIFIFSQSTLNLNLIFEKLRKILLEFKLFINFDKVCYCNSKFQVASCVASHVFEVEKQKRNEYEQYGFLKAATLFTLKYPKSNKIFSILTSLNKNLTNYNVDNVIDNFKIIYNNSKTCILPMLIGIIDKCECNNKDQKIINFLNSINLYKATDTDILWAKCLCVKYQINYSQLEYLIDQQNQDFKTIIQNIEITDQTDLFKDADTFFYE